MSRGRRKRKSLSKDTNEDSDNSISSGDSTRAIPERKRQRRLSQSSSNNNEPIIHSSDIENWSNDDDENRSQSLLSNSASAATTTSSTSANQNNSKTPRFEPDLNPFGDTLTSLFDTNSNSNSNSQSKLKPNVGAAKRKSNRKSNSKSESKRKTKLRSNRKYKNEDSDFEINLECENESETETEDDENDPDWTEFDANNGKNNIKYSVGGFATRVKGDLSRFKLTTNGTTTVSNGNDRKNKNSNSNNSSSNRKNSCKGKKSKTSKKGRTGKKISSKNNQSKISNGNNNIVNNNNSDDGNKNTIECGWTEMSPVFGSINGENSNFPFIFDWSVMKKAKSPDIIRFDTLKRQERQKYVRSQGLTKAEQEKRRQKQNRDSARRTREKMHKYIAILEMHYKHTILANKLLVKQLEVALNNWQGDKIENLEQRSWPQEPTLDDYINVKPAVLSVANSKQLTKTQPKLKTKNNATRKGQVTQVVTKSGNVDVSGNSVNLNQQVRRYNVKDIEMAINATNSPNSFKKGKESANGSKGGNGENGPNMEDVENGIGNFMDDIQSWRSVYNIDKHIIDVGQRRYIRHNGETNETRLSPSTESVNVDNRNGKPNAKVSHISDRNEEEKENEHENKVRCGDKQENEIKMEMKKNNENDGGNPNSVLGIINEDNLPQLPLPDVMIIGVKEGVAVNSKSKLKPKTKIGRKVRKTTKMKSTFTVMKESATAARTTGRTRMAVTRRQTQIQGQTEERRGERASHMVDMSNSLNPISLSPSGNTVGSGASATDVATLASEENFNPEKSINSMGSCFFSNNNNNNNNNNGQMGWGPQSMQMPPMPPMPSIPPMAPMSSMQSMGGIAPMAPMAPMAFMPPTGADMSMAGMMPNFMDPRWYQYPPHPQMMAQYYQQQYQHWQRFYGSQQQQQAMMRRQSRPPMDNPMSSLIQAPMEPCQYLEALDKIDGDMLLPPPLTAEIKQIKETKEQIITPPPLAVSDKSNKNIHNNNNNDSKDEKISTNEDSIATGGNVSEMNEMNLANLSMNKNFEMGSNDMTRNGNCGLDKFAFGPGAPNMFRSSSMASLYGGNNFVNMDMSLNSVGMGDMNNSNGKRMNDGNNNGWMSPIGVNFDHETAVLNDSFGFTSTMMG